MATAVDWSAKPEPWRSMRLSFRAQCEAIASGKPAPVPPPARSIRVLREHLGLTKMGLARIVGVDPTTVLNAERGVAKPESVQRILDALDRLEAERRQDAA